MFKMALRDGKKPDKDVIIKLEEALQFMDKFLQEQDWLAGSTISIADYAVVADLLVIDVRISNLWPNFVSESYLWYLTPVYVFAYLQKVSEFSISIPISV
jgi:glutathione S-transferase